MTLSRRDFLKASSAIASAFGLRLPEALGASAPPGSNGGTPVVWLQAQSCSGCSVSLLNSIYYDTVDHLLTNTLDVKYHPTVMAAAGDNAVAAAQAAKGTTGYVLVVEGAIPTKANGEHCYLWPGMTALAGVQQYAPNAGFILGVGTCSCYGGVVGGKPNPTGVQPLSAIVGSTRVINIPGCPAHPDWIVGTIAYLIKNKKAPPLDTYRRPVDYFKTTVHEQCPYHDDEGEGRCLLPYGCKGKVTRADCPRRRWNSPAAGAFGVNWCIGEGYPNGTPCHGCAEPGFPDTMSPFYKGSWQGGGSGGGDGGGESDDEHESGGGSTGGGSGGGSGGETDSEHQGGSDRPRKKPTPYERRLEERRKAYEKAQQQRRNAARD
jgi:hydrogenase small subunit